MLALVKARQIDDGNCTGKLRRYPKVAVVDGPTRV